MRKKKKKQVLDFYTNILTKQNHTYEPACKYSGGKGERLYCNPSWAGNKTISPL